MTGTETNMIRKAAARPTVMGKPRTIRLSDDSRGDSGGALVAMASPTASGTRIARPNQTSRTTQEGIQ